MDLIEEECRAQDNFTLHNCLVIALYYFLNLIFVQSITQKDFEIST
jgi:hypothetical protein